MKFNLRLIKQEVFFNEDESGDYTIDYEVEQEEEINSFEELIETLDACIANECEWGEWSSSHPNINADWLTSYEEQDYLTGASVTYTLHFNPVHPITLDQDQLKRVEKALGVLA